MTIVARLRCDDMRRRLALCVAAIVTGQARRLRRHMIEAGARECIGALMARVAGRLRWRMTKWLARRGDAIVACRAGTYGAHMIETSLGRRIRRKSATGEVSGNGRRQNASGVCRHANREAHCRMVAIGARRRRRYMRRRLAARDSTVVAGHAFRRRLQMIDDLDVRKESRLMASGAFQRRWRVIWRFADRAVAIVARRTSVKRVLVLPVEMTSLAGSLRMRAGEGEFRLRMIERAL